MDWFKRNPLLGSVLLLLAAVLAVEGRLWLLYRQQSLRALAALEQKKQDRDWLARQSPALSAENEQAIARDLANTRQVLAALRLALQGKDGNTPASPPAKAIDLYFDLAAFVEKTRALAAHATVQIKPDERFGFASHANEGPEADLVPAVFRQRVIAQYLVEALLEARPRALLAVQRERPLTAAARAQRNQPPTPGTPAAALPAAAGGVPADFFEFDPALSVRVPGRVDGDAFRLEFTGQTTTLRTFLNTLASFKLPVVVRSVEVAPLAGEELPADPAAPLPVTGAPVPLVSQNLSKFAVVVEYVLLNASPEKPAP